MIYLLVSWISIFFYAIHINENILLANYIALSLWLYTVIYFFKKSSSFFILSFAVLFAFTVAGVSSLVAEYGLFFSEIRVWASLTGATARILSLSALIVLAAFFTFNLLSKVKTINASILPYKLNNYLLHLSLFISIICIILLFAIFIKYGHPNHYGVDRFYYWNHIAPQWTAYVKFTLAQLSIFMGLLYITQKKKKILLIFILSLLAQMLIGEKFTSIFTSVMIFCIPVVIFSKFQLAKLIFNTKFFLLLLAFGSFLFATTYFSYVSISGEEAAIDRFLDRLVLQAQLWWALDDLATMDRQSLFIIKEHFLGIGQDNPFMQGIFYIMYLVSPESIYESFITQGVSMTMGGPINLAYFFGYPLSIIAALILGSALGLVYFILYKAIIIKDILFIFLAIKGVDGIYRVTVMGDAFHLLSAKVHLTFVVFIIYTFLSYYFYNRQENNENIL